MGTRFSKRAKIIPGVTLNIGKTGSSISVGGHGFKKTYSKNGVRTTVGIPGTGLSHTTYRKYETSGSGARFQSYTPQQQVPIRSSSENKTWGYIFLFLAIATVIISFAYPHIYSIGRWIIAIFGGGFFLIGAIVFFTAKSKEDIARQADYMHKLNEIGDELTETQKLLEQRQREIGQNK